MWLPVKKFPSPATNARSACSHSFQLMHRTPIKKQFEGARFVNSAIKIQCHIVKNTAFSAILPTEHFLVTLSVASHLNFSISIHPHTQQGEKLYREGKPIQTLIFLKTSRLHFYKLIQTLNTRCYPSLFESSIRS